MALHPAGPFAAALAPAVAPLAWDVGSAVFSLLITLAWLKSVSLATQAGALAPNFSRKLVHSTCGTGFMLLWCIYSDAPSARLLAAVVPALQLVRLWLAGSSTEDASASELVSTLSRTGKRKEALGGPFLCAARAIRSAQFSRRNSAHSSDAFFSRLAGTRGCSSPRRSSASARSSPPSPSARWP